MEREASQMSLTEGFNGVNQINAAKLRQNMENKVKNYTQ